MSRKSFILIISILPACIGTDIIEVPKEIPVLSITSLVESIKVGESFQFTYSYTDESGIEQNIQPVWSSSNPEILSIDQQGLAQGLTDGQVTVRVDYDQLSDQLDLQVADETVIITQKTALFSGSNGYTVNGTAQLSGNQGAVTLSFLSDFNTANGPGLYIYMSNSPTSVSGGVELAALKSTSGFQSYPLPQSAGLNTYRFVIVYCKPFGVVFGKADFN